MEGFLPLIIIIIVINVINALTRAFRGGKKPVQGRPAQVSPPPPPPERKIKLWDDEYDDVNPGAEPGRSDLQFSETAETDYSAESYYPEVVPPLERTGDQAAEQEQSVIGSVPEGPALKVERKQVVCPDNIGNTRLGKLFSSGDSFVSAYILHEILSPPVTRRRK